MTGYTADPLIISKGDINSALIKKLRNFFMRRSEVLFAFLFGSFADKRMTAYSDIDIGIFFRDTPDFYATESLRENLTALLKRPADIVVLNAASPVLKMQVLKKGIPVFMGSRKYFNAFYVDTLNQYDDLKQLRKKYEEDILKGRIYA